MKIFIDPGHGGSDPGAVSKIKEANYTLSYALELGKALSLLGLEVSYSRTGDIFVPLAERGPMANKTGADYFISIHFNAGGGKGIETYALMPGGKSEKLAKAVQATLVSYTGMSARGVKFANFQVLRDTNMPAILIEGGFVDSSDVDMIANDENKKNFVRGVSKGLCAFLGLQWKDPYASVAAETEKPVNNDPDIYLSVRVRASKADALVQEIKQMGYACKKMDLA